MIIISDELSLGTCNNINRSEITYGLALYIQDDDCVCSPTKILKRHACSLSAVIIVVTRTNLINWTT